MELHDITMDDLPLYESLLTDPGTTAELGGPLAREPLAEKLRGIVRDVKQRRIWYFTIVRDDSDERAGTVCVWSHDGDDEPINEIGWMVLPAFRGRAWRAARCGWSSSGRWPSGDGM